MICSFIVNDLPIIGAFLPDGLETFLQKFGWQALTDLFIPTHAPDLKGQIEKYKSSIENGHKVLVVAHSQGNLFTYEAYNGLPGWMQNYFEAVSVASPMSANIKENTPRIARLGASLEVKNTKT